MQQITCIYVDCLYNNFLCSPLNYFEMCGLLRVGFGSAFFNSAHSRDILVRLEGGLLTERQRGMTCLEVRVTSVMGDTPWIPFHTMREGTDVYVSLWWTRTILCLAFVFLYRVTRCSLSHQASVSPLLNPSSLEERHMLQTSLNPDTAQLLRHQSEFSASLFAGWKYWYYSSCGQHKPCCWWGSWKKENTENAVTHSLYLPETVASFIPEQKCLVTCWIHLSNILQSLCYLASCELPLISTNLLVKTQQAQALLH